MMYHVGNLLSSGSGTKMFFVLCFQLSCTYVILPNFKIWKKELQKKIYSSTKNLGVVYLQMRTEKEFVDNTKWIGG